VISFRPVNRRSTIILLLSYGDGVIRLVRLGGKTNVARGRRAHWPLQLRGEDADGDDRDSIV